MIKQFLSLSIVLLGLVFTTYVSAQEIRQESRGYQCLDFAHCSDGGSNDENRRCPPRNDDAAHTSAHWGHRSQVDLTKLEGLPPNSEVLVTECLSADVDLDGDGKNDPICTTGDSTQDKMLFCGSATATSPTCDHLAILQEKLNYSLDRSQAGVTTHGVFHLINGVFQKSNGIPIKVGSNGKPTVEKVEWEAHTPGNLTRKYLAWTYSRETSTPTPTIITVTTAPTGGVGGQQQAILNFEQRTPVPTSPPPEVNDCKGKAWDPYGKVFDTQSLEPIPNANVFLKQKNLQNVFDSEYAKSENLLIVNPFPTDLNGEYIFFVKDGDYSLQPIKAGYIHLASNQQSSLLPNTLAIYSDIYFNDSPPILQRGAIQHRDIPLIPTDGVGKEYPLQVMVEESETLADGSMVYSGKLSHPFAEVIVETCSLKQEVEVCSNPQVFGSTNGGADKYGNFTFTLDQTKLLPGEYYRRTFRKVDLKSQTTAKIQPFNVILGMLVSILRPKAVNAQEPSNYARIQPIVSYIEGYAYDAEGNLLPNATILIKVPLSEMPVYKTAANANGYYKITSEFLPNTEYSIEYSVGNESARITTSQMLEQNKNFIATEKIDPFLNTTQASDPRRNVTPSYMPEQKISAVPNEFAPAPSISVQESQAQTTTNNNVFLIGGILVLLIAAAGVLIGVHLYRKRMQETEL